MRGMPGLKACESQPNPILDAKSELIALVLRLALAIHPARLVLEIKFRQLHIRRRRDLEIPRRTHDYGHRLPCPFQERSLVRAKKSIGRGIAERLFQQAVA